MKKETNTKFVCDGCGRKYDFETEAAICEAEHKRELRRNSLTEFTITDNHLKLLKEMNVNWDECEFGAPCIDPKRPYGNSDGVNDVARVIGFKMNEKTVEYDKDELEEYDDKKEYFENCDWTDKSYDYLFDLHREMETVLQIVLTNLCFEPKTYVRENIWSNWRPKE